jgi:hypothetical protein
MVSGFMMIEVVPKSNRSKPSNDRNCCIAICIGFAPGNAGMVVSRQLAQAAGSLGS